MLDNAPYQTAASERRIATVMFADMAGFTALSEKCDAELVSRLMNDFFSAMEITIDRHGGVVDKFIGDCVMALFGVPVTKGNSAVNAVNAALAMRKKAVAIGKKNRFPAPINLRVGINTGRVLAGTIGGEKRRDYTVIGDAVNVASRIEGLSRGGQILVGPNTWAATRNQFHYKRMPPVTLKGKAKPVAVFELLEPIRPAVGVAANRPGTGARTVGRDSQFSLVASLLSTRRLGPGRIINITGEAGIGKSHLIEGLRKASRLRGYPSLDGTALSVGRNISYHPFATMLRGWSDISESDDDRTALDKLAAAVNGLGEENSEEAVLHIAPVLGIKLLDRQTDGVRRLDAGARELLLSRHIKQLLERLARQHPLMVIMEDLHWADKSSLSLLSSLFRLATSVPVFFVNGYRPGYANMVDRLMKAAETDFGRLVTNVPLGLLSRAASKILVDDLASDTSIPEAVKKEIVDRTGGNPYFINEVVASAKENSGHASSWPTVRIVRASDNPSIPATVNDVLMERIDRLDGTTRRLIRMAAVIGKLFLPNILRKIADNSVAVERHLDHLLSAGFIIRYCSSPETKYEFKHALIQEAVYASILRDQRKKWHRRIASAIRQLYARRLKQFYGMLAYHYSRAEDLDNAEKYMMMAGREALKIGGSNEAISHYRQAFAMYLQKSGAVSDPIKIGTFERHIARALYNQGRHKDACRYYERALARYGHRDPRHKPVRHLLFLFGLIRLLLSLYTPVFFWRKTPSEQDTVVAELYYKKLASLANVDPNRFLTGAVSFARYLSKFNLKMLKSGVGMLAGLSVAFAWSAGSFAVSRKVISLIGNKGWQLQGKSALYVTLAQLFTDYYTGHWEKPYDGRLVEHGLKMGEVMHTAAYILFHGRIQLETGNYKTAKQLTAKLADIADTFSHDFSRGMQYYLSAKLLVKYRKMEAARLELEEGVQYAARTDFKQLLFVFYAFSARVHIYNNDGTKAEQSLARAERLTENLPITAPYLSNYLISKLSFCIHKLAGAQTSPSGSAVATWRKEAGVICRKTIAISRKLTHERPEVYRLAGTFYYLNGRWKQADKWWVRSMREGEKLGARLELCRTYLVVGKYLADSGKKLGGRSADECYRLARNLSDELQLHWEMTRWRDIVRIG